MKMWLTMEKGARIRFTGHLDLMRTMQRALRRSGLPVRYSQGFNPHMLLNAAAPLSLGMPGLRELGMIGAEEGISETFSDIAELISQCAFSDCTHGNEPGCAVRQALEDGTLAPERWKMYARLERENKWNKTAKNGRMMNIAMFRRQMKQERKGRG